MPQNEGWRELGAFFQIYFRLHLDGRIELLGNIPKGQDIDSLCKTLSKQLAREISVQKKYIALAQSKSPKFNQKRVQKSFLKEIRGRDTA